MLIPQTVIDGFLDQPFDLEGAFNTVKSTGPDPSGMDSFYTEEEKDYIRGCLSKLFNHVTQGKTPVHKAEQRFLLTAGAPGTGKSVLLEYELAHNPEYKNYVYLDPDEVAIKLIDRYVEMVNSFDDKRDGLRVAYTKWRHASNYLHNSLMNMCAEQGYNIALGTTATGGGMKFLYKALKENSLKIKTLVVAADDETRAESLKQRYNIEQSRFLPDDHAIDKADAFLSAFPMYFEQSGELELYWRDHKDQNAALAFKTRTKIGQSTITDKAALQSFEGYMNDNGKEKTFTQAIGLSA